MNTMHLEGADAVQRAASTIGSAATSIVSAAAEIRSASADFLSAAYIVQVSLSNHQLFLEGWITRMEKLFRGEGQ